MDNMQGSEKYRMGPDQKQPRYGRTLLSVLMVLALMAASGLGVYLVMSWQQPFAADGNGRGAQVELLVLELLLVLQMLLEFQNLFCTQVF